MDKIVLVLLALSWIQIGVLSYYMYEVREAIKLYLVNNEEL